MSAGLLTALETARDAARFGGKAAQLAQLASAGFPTAPGVALPAATFDAHLARAGLAPAAAIFAQLLELDAAAARAEAARLREQVAGLPLDSQLVDAIGAMLARHALLAVRSSALGEDGATASFAGVFDTCLGVADAEHLVRALLQVWASFFGDRVLAYARHLGARPLGMAVVLQAQVPATLSGVLFTRAPFGASDEVMLLECCAGLGERLVGGAIVPDRFSITRAAGSLRQLAVGTDAVSPTVAEARCLAAIGLRLERQFGGPQDVEWSRDPVCGLVLLQTRPITALGAKPARIAWSNANIAENFPDPVSPFLASFVGRGYSAYFRGLGEAFGISRRRREAMAHALDHLTGNHAGRLYYNLTHIHAVLQLAPGGRHLARYFNQFTGAEGEHAGVSPAAAAGWLGAMELPRIVVRVLWHYLTVEWRLRRFERRIDAFAAHTAPVQLAVRPALDLAADIRAFLDIRTRHWTDAALADTAAMVCYGLLKTLLAWRLDPDGGPAAHNDLLKGMPGLASARPVEALWALSRQVRGHAGLRALAGDGSPAAFIEALHAPEHAALRAALDEYFERWGFRYSGELTLTQPTPQEDPLPVLRLLRAFALQDGPGPAETSAQQQRDRELTTAALAARLTPARWLRALPLPSAARIFRLLLAATQGAIRLRERARMKQALLYTRLRHVALALGDRLVAGGVLAARDDVFMLSTDEAIALAEGDALLPAAVGATVAARRVALTACAGLTPPDAFTLAAGEQWAPRAAASRPAADAAAAAPLAGAAACLTGSGACGGTAQGRAAVVADVTEADRIGPGDVLVTRQTDPGWAAVFFLIRGLVIERGGMLSHGAIIAREYGIPAVVGVRDATRLIADGSHVRVDGNQGTVELRGG